MKLQVHRLHNKSCGYKTTKERTGKCLEFRKYVLYYYRKSKNILIDRGNVSFVVVTRELVKLCFELVS